uniref:Minor coat protein n=1 Tax=Tomato chlorosis virus TaxID=67754 RepID=A0A097ZQT5_9CLOS|nr:minor coat protein [Tomato chlorosis virus]
MDENEIYEDQEDLSARGGGGFYYQTVTLGSGDVFPVDLALTRSAEFDSTIFSLYIRFVIKEGNVRLKIDFGNNWDVTMQQVRLSGWFAAFGKIEKPRTARSGWSYPIKLFKEAGEVIVSISGWRCYKIYNGYPVDRVDLVLAVPVREVTADLKRPLVGDYVNFHDVFTLIKSKNSDITLPNPSLIFNDSTSKVNLDVSPGARKQIAQVKAEKDLNIKNPEDSKPDVPNDSLSEVEYHNHSDVSSVFRLYYTWRVERDFERSVESRIFFPNIFPTDFTILQQMWYGTTAGNVETFVEIGKNERKFNVGVAAWKDNAFGHFKLDGPTLAKISTIPGRFVDHKIEKDPKGHLIVSVDNTVLVRTNKLIVKPSIQIGWEFHLPWDAIGKYGVGNLARFTDIIKPNHIKYDGSEVPLVQTNTIESDRSKSGHKLSLVNLKSFRRISSTADFFFEPPPPSESDDKTWEDKNQTEVDIKKEETIPTNEGTSSSDLPSEKSQFVAANHYLLSIAEDRNIFKAAVDRYTGLGFSKDQAVLIIYQLGVTFGTSRNCCSDNSSFLVWKTDTGAQVIIRKGAHSRFLNSLVKYPCNVERLILRRRSAEILALLRNKKLAYPDRLAKKKGVSQGFTYMACDFLDYTAVTLTQEEQLTMNSVVQYVRLHNKHRRSIVSTSQLF